jgi:hypothetical protein
VYDLPAHVDRPIGPLKRQLDDRDGTLDTRAEGTWRGQ